MSIIVVSEYVVAAMLAWVSVACLFGVIRYNYRPLLLSTVGGGLMSVAAFARAIDGHEHAMSPMIGAFHYFGILCIAIYLTRYSDALRRRGICWRQLLFFSRG
jgi:hypothetical protein